MAADGLFTTYRLRRQFRFDLSEVLAALAKSPEDAGLTNLKQPDRMVRHGKSKTKDAEREGDEDERDEIFYYNRADDE